MKVESNKPVRNSFLLTIKFYRTWSRVYTKNQMEEYYIHVVNNIMLNIFNYL